MPKPKQLRSGFYAQAAIACFLLLLLLPSASVRADFYKWVDNKGIVHFSDKPPSPSESNQDVEARPDSPPSTYRPPEKQKPPSDDSGDAPSKAPTDRVTSTPKVELYVTSWCKYCKLAKAFLKRNRITYTAYDIEKDPQAAARRRSIDQRSGVPLAVINGYVILGFSEAAYKRALDAKQ
jgi:glutaredoxin